MKRGYSMKKSVLFLFTALIVVSSFSAYAPVSDASGDIGVSLQSDRETGTVK
jgi:hypothetical protein